ncbi:RNA polymerase sigma factor [Neorhizobium galegae]|uniref:RNA polymerase sigma factor n=1 Tax=Neorhizobium galegae TaxID=399 RepID=UPI0034E2F80E
MSEPDRGTRAEFTVLAEALRPELHRYCARLMGSVIDGEDVVQDTFAKALVALEDLYEAPHPRAWLFKIAHNRALDLLRGRAIRAAEPVEAAENVVDEINLDPLESLMHEEAMHTAVSRFHELPVLQRRAVILKDVLDEPLAEIACLLGITIDAVKGHLARGVRGSGRSMLKASRFRTGRHPPLPRCATFRCSTSGTGMVCARSSPRT